MDFFVVRVSGDKHCVNFPYLASILAELQDERRRFVLANVIAVALLV